MENKSVLKYEESLNIKIKLTCSTDSPSSFLFVSPEGRCRYSRSFGDVRAMTTNNPVANDCRTAQSLATNKPLATEYRTEQRPVLQPVGRGNIFS